MTPTTVARAKSLAKSLRSECKRCDLEVSLSSCQAVIAVGSGSLNWHDMTSTLLDGRRLAPWNQNNAAVTLSEKAKIPDLMAEGILGTFQERIDGRPDFYSDRRPSFEIFDELRVEVTDWEIVASVRDADRNWVPLDPEVVSFDVPSFNAHPDETQFLLDILGRASKVDPRDKSDHKKILAGLRKNIKMPVPPIEELALPLLTEIVAITIRELLNDLLDNCVGGLDDKESAIDSVQIIPGKNDLTKIQRYIDHVDAIVSLKPSYRPFLRFIPLITFDENRSATNDWIKVFVDQGFGIVDDADHLRALKWLRTAHEAVVDKVLDDLFVEYDAFSVPSDMLRHSAYQYHPSMIQAAPYLSFHEKAGYDAFGALQEIVTEIDDPIEGFEVQGWLARQVVLHEEFPVLKKGFEEIFEAVRDDISCENVEIPFDDFKIIMLDFEDLDEEIDSLRIHFGNNRLLYALAHNPDRYVAFVIDTLGHSLQDLALVIVDKDDDMSYDIALAGDLEPNEKLQDIADFFVTEIDESV